MYQFISKEKLDAISYTSTLQRSLKQISLRKIPLENILADIAIYRSIINTVLTKENITGSRFKSNDSIMRKYNKTLQTGGGFKQCFNDVLSFRLKFDKYPNKFPEYFRVVDLRNGKKIDDGYRAIHLYYQRDNHSYPIEIQLWCGIDYEFNLWSHQFIYKYLAPEIGKQLYDEFHCGIITCKEDFIQRLKSVYDRGV